MCGLPAFRKALCQRHYTYVKQGRRELPVEHLHSLKGYKAKQVAVYLPPQVVELAAKEAEAANRSLSYWILDLVVARLGVTLPALGGSVLAPRDDS